MNHKLVLILYLCIASVCSAPMQVQVLPMQSGNGLQQQLLPMQYGNGLQQQLLPMQYGNGLQQQLLPTQFANGLQQQLNPFLKQMLPNVKLPMMPMYPQQPTIILLPNTATNTADDRYVNLNEHDANVNLKSNTGHTDENKDAVVIDDKPISPETQSKNALVYLPNEGRFAIGTIISHIPFLPVEINVPETISWITNVLGGGWLWPALFPASDTKGLSNKGQMPVIVMPYPGAMPQV